MPNEEHKKSGEDRQPKLPSTGEGADSALDVLKQKRREVPPQDPTLPVKPPQKKP